jgi:hypothetical protein
MLISSSSSSSVPLCSALLLSLKRLRRDHHGARRVVL